MYRVLNFLNSVCLFFLAAAAVAAAAVVTSSGPSSVVRRQKRSAPKEEPEKVDEEEWSLKDVIFVEDSPNFPMIGRVLKVTDLGCFHTDMFSTVGIRKPTIQIPDSFENRTF